MAEDIIATIIWYILTTVLLCYIIFFVCGIIGDTECSQKAHGLDNYNESQKKSKQNQYIPKPISYSIYSQKDLCIKTKQFKQFIDGYTQYILTNKYIPNDIIAILYLYYYGDWKYLLCDVIKSNKEIWGSYSQNKNALLSVANIQIFASETYILHFAQNKYSWFYQNRLAFPKHLFFIIIHLRMNDALNISIIQYYYMNKNKFDSVTKKKEDETTIFCNFINGSCKYRNDRLKISAKRIKGPWYVQIPSKPLIIGKQMLIKYYRAYSTKSSSCTIERDDIGVPCKCGSCQWINNNGEYCEYLEIDIDPDLCQYIFIQCVLRKIAPISKSLEIELDWILQQQNNNELTEMILANCQLNNIGIMQLYNKVN